MRFRVAAAALVVFAMTVPHALAGDSNGGAACGAGTVLPGGQEVEEPWVGADFCHFEFKGFPITVQGDAQGPLNEAEIRVWVEVRYASDFEIPEPIVILECSATDASYPPVDRHAQCSGGLPNETMAPLWPTSAKFLTLTCRVEGFRSGWFKCISGLGT